MLFTQSLVPHVSVFETPFDVMLHEQLLPLEEPDEPDEPDDPPEEPDELDPPSDELQPIAIPRKLTRKSVQNRDWYISLFRLQCQTTSYGRSLGKLSKIRHRARRESIRPPRALFPECGEHDLG